MATGCLTALAIAALLPLVSCGVRSEAYSFIPPGSTYVPPAPPGILMAGTDLVVRASDNIDTDRAVAGVTYPAQIANAVVDAQGQTIIPAGSPAELMIVSSYTGSVVGTPELALALGSVTIDGVDHDVVSDAAAREVSLRGLGGNAGGPRFIGGGALLGTLVGAVAGRGTGALQVFTKGRSIRVPGETLLTFQLDRPLRIEDYPRR